MEPGGSTSRVAGWRSEALPVLRRHTYATGAPRQLLLVTNRRRPSSKPYQRSFACMYCARPPLARKVLPHRSFGSMSVKDWLSLSRAITDSAASVVLRQQAVSIEHYLSWLEHRLGHATGCFTGAQEESTSEGSSVASPCYACSEVGRGVMSWMLQGLRRAMIDTRRHKRPGCSVSPLEASPRAVHPNQISMILQQRLLDQQRNT